MSEIILEGKDVCRYFGGLKAVNKVNMQVEKGAIYGIIGPNGAGKTTFFNLCAGSFPLTSGEIWFDGQNITKFDSVESAKAGIARTFQNLQLFRNMTVLENIIVGFHLNTRTNIFDGIFHTPAYKKDEKYAKEEGEKLLESLDLIQYKDTLAKNLAYGTQRKVEIGRALALKPKVLLLDEPAAGMNPMETQELSDFIKKIRNQGITIVVIEHDMKFIMNLCERILVLDHGEKLMEGTPLEVSRSEAVAEAYFGKGLIAKKEDMPNAADQ